jgi:hypothetical protein
MDMCPRHVGGRYVPADDQSRASLALITLGLYEDSDLSVGAELSQHPFRTIYKRKNARAAGLADKEETAKYATTDARVRYDRMLMYECMGGWLRRAGFLHPA